MWLTLDDTVLRSESQPQKSRPCDRYHMKFPRKKILEAECRSVVFLRLGWGPGDQGVTVNGVGFLSEVLKMLQNRQLKAKHLWID